MSKSMNMLRTRRRDNNVKPNRRDPSYRLDRKSSRGMIYENEELRLRTININAEIERGQYDIKKLKRENEMLKKEIWCLRDEYDKLDKLLKEKEYDFSSSSSSDSESCSSCSEESDQVEKSQNFENVQKTNMKNLHQEFDHLSIVPEEASTEKSDSIPDDVIKADQSYPNKQNFFNELPTLEKTASDLIVKSDNCEFNQSNRSTFSNGGNLEELLNDIETISQDILKITNDQKDPPKPYKSELNVVLMPNPMPLLGFEKYRNLGKVEDTPNAEKAPTSSDLISSENEENLKFQTSKVDDEKKSPSLRRKVSIHFKGKNNFLNRKNSKKTPSLESKRSTDPTSSGSERKKDEKKKSISISPDRKHVHVKDEKRHKKHKRLKNRRGTISSVDRLNRERSFSVCTDRSNFEHRYYDDSDRERTNSLSSCESLTRKMSTISNIPLNGKVPWCACWGNGCI